MFRMREEETKTNEISQATEEKSNNVLTMSSADDAGGSNHCHAVPVDVDPSVAVGDAVASMTSPPQLSSTEQQPPPLPPRQDERSQRIFSLRSAEIVRAAEAAESSDSVLSHATSEELDHEDEAESDNNPLGSAAKKKRKQQSRTPSLQYMQDSSVEVTMTVDNINHNSDPSTASTRTRNDSILEEEEDAESVSSWSKVEAANKFQSSRSAVVQSSSLPPPLPPTATAAGQRKSSKTGRNSSMRANQSTIIPLLQGQSNMLLTKMTTREVLKHYEIIIELEPNDDSTVEGMASEEDEEAVLLYQLLFEFARTYRYPSPLTETIRVVLPGSSLNALSQVHLQLDEKRRSSSSSSVATGGGDGGSCCCKVIQLLTAGYAAQQPALLQCSTRFAAAFLQCVGLILTQTAVEPLPATESSSATCSNKSSTSGSFMIDHRVLYTSAHFQSHRLWKQQQTQPTTLSHPALTVVWGLWKLAARRVDVNRDLLCGPLGQLLVILGVAGVTPQFLRELLHQASTTADTSVRWSLVRALTLMAEGASGRSIAGPISLLDSSDNHNNSNNKTRKDNGKSEANGYPPSSPYPSYASSRSGSHDVFVVGPPSSPIASPVMSVSPPPPQEHFFIWTGKPEGWKRKISGLSSWPFRNDFGMALWFRADHLDPSRYPVLLSYRAETAASSSSRIGGGGGGGGVDVSLVPLGRGGIGGTQQHVDACTIQVTVYDCDKQVPAQTIHVSGCVLFGNVWYHLAVRHSNARLKGVFSLSTRQQISILVNGKVILQQPLVFPKIVNSAADASIHDRKSESATTATTTLLPAVVRAVSAATARRPSTSGGMNHSGMYSCTWNVCSDFQGQTSAIYVFNDSVSDASFRALYQATGGSSTNPNGVTSPLLSKASSLSSDKDRWDSRKSSIVKKSRVLDVNIMNDDADEVVLSQRRVAMVSRQKRNAAVVDVVFASGSSGMVGGDDDTVIGSSSSSHHNQLEEDIFVVSAGGGDLLKPASFGSKVFVVWDPRRTIGDLAIEVHLGAHLSLGQDAHYWSVSPPQDVIASIGGIQALIPLFRSLLEGDISSTNGMSHILLLLKAFLQDHDDNSRELLRCGGIDVIEQLVYKAGNQLFKSLHTQTGLASLLVRSLLELRSACAHYVGLETKVFPRLLFNIPLWLGNTHGDALQGVLLPVLSSITRANSDKVRDCVGIRDMVHVLLSLRQEESRDSVNRSPESGDDSALLQTADVLLGMIFEVLSSGVTPQDFSPLLCGLNYNLETVFNSSVADGRPMQWQLSLATKMSAVLLFLLQVRPPIPGLFESFAQCCGSVQAGVAWLLCSMVNSVDDTVRSLGLRCAAEYLDVTSNGADYPLSLGQTTDTTEANVSGDVHSSVRRLGRIAKGFVVMGPGVRSADITPSKQTPRVAVKLLWHLLKSHRAELGDASYSSLVFGISDDGGIISASLASLDYIQSHLISESRTCQPGYRFCMEWAESILAETGSIVGRSLKSPLLLAAILRLLRYLNGAMQERWLTDLLTLTKASRRSTSLLSSLPDWQPSLFHLISETLELLVSVSSKKDAVVDQTSDALDYLPNGRGGPQTQKDQSKALASVGRRLDLCLELYSTLLGHLVREGGEKSLDVVEQAVSLERVCVNGHDVIFLVLSALCANLFNFGTILEMGSISAQDWKDVDFDNDSLPLKQSARLVTDAILSNGAKGLDMPSAVNSWRSLRHLTALIVAISVKSGFGVVDLFDYNYHQAASVDSVSGGLHGIRLRDGNSENITYSAYLAYIEAAGYRRRSTDDEDVEFRRDVDRRLCACLSSQILTILDAFIFPESLDEALPASQLHGLALVRNSEPRLGPSQGPLVASAMRLSLVLVALLEPGSVKLLQCASRMRCLLSWALELTRERVSSDTKTKPSDDVGGLLDRVLVATLIHSHRALGRCSALLTEIESSSFEEYFDSRDSHKKHHRRLLRTALELREVVLTIYRGRNDVLKASLSTEAFDALRVSLEGSYRQAISKESVVKDFLASNWVAGFQDVETRMEIAVPEQLSMGSIPLSSDQEPSTDGFSVVEKLALETKSIASDFEKTMNGCFEDYLEATRRWAETDAVRDLEFDGDSTARRLSEKHKTDSNEVSRSILMRRNGAENRWRRIYSKAAEPWESELHWKLATHTDRTGRRTLLVPNRKFNDHEDASYELMMEKEREKAERERRARLRDKELSEVMRRNVEAFTMHDSVDIVDGRDDDSSAVQASDGESSDVGSISGGQSVGPSCQGELPADESEHDEEWDRIETEEYQHVNADGDVDAWAKLFIWSDFESAVARFDNITIVSLQSYVEGKLLLTTHGLYFQQVGEELSGITKCPIDGHESTITDTKHRRWRHTRLTEVHGRRYLLRHQALELFFSDGQQLFLNFSGGPKERDRFYAKLRNSCKVPMLSSLKSLNPRSIFRKSRLCELWQQRKISNFDYLMALNRMAGRSFNDLTQYPVFPWVLADYTNETINLNDSGVYRDLTKPIGALNPDRLSQLLERYRDLELFGFSEAEKFLYGSHYSSPGIVLHYLIRQEPFTTMSIELQSGRFDCPDRLFFDVASSWNGCLASSSDMKELIPEFFFLPEMFLNTNKFPLGRTQGGRLVDNVGLPPWAKGSAYEFVRIHRLALESEYVSQTLHHWIDLIFGYKQRGPEAEAAHNIFHHLSYEGTVDLDKIVDEVDRQAAESHIQNFGQTPSQLLVADPHPCRYPAADCWKPLIDSVSVPRNLRCYTPSKQFGNKGSDLANGSVLKIHVLSETIFVVYADMSVGTYRWFPNSKSNRLRMDKLRSLPRRELSTSRSAVKRGSTIPHDKHEESSRFIGNWSFAVTIGGLAKAELRRKAILPPTARLITSTETTLASAETSGFLISCGFWDDTVKVHSTESLRLLASETGGHRGPIRCFAEDDGLLVTGGEDATCRIWAVGHSDMSIALSDGYVQTALGASNDGDQLLSCCHVLWGHETSITSLDLDSDLDAVASGSHGLVCIHSIRRGEFIRSFRVPSVSDPDKYCEGAVRKIALDSTGNLVLHMHDCGLHTFTVNAVLLSSTDAGEHLLDMIMCSRGEILVTGGMNCEVLIRSVHDLQVLSMLDLTRHGPIRCIGLTPDDLNPTKQFLFVGSDDGMITIVDDDPAHERRV